MQASQSSVAEFVRAWWQWRTVCQFSQALTMCAMVALASYTTAGEPWQRHTIDNTSRGADGVRLADFNSDGHQDVVTGWEEGGLVRVYQNPGPQKSKQLWPQVTVGKVASPEDAVFADLNSDGNLDVVSSCEGRNQAIYFHWAPDEKEKYLDPSAWKTEKLPASQGTMWMFCLPLQIDGRHGIDLVVGGKGGGANVGWFEAPANPRDVDAWKFHKLIDAGWIMSLQTHDMDEDGDLDIVMSDRKGKHRGVKWLANPGEKAVVDGQPWKVHRVGDTNQEVMFLDLHYLESGDKLLAWATKGGPVIATGLSRTGDVSSIDTRHAFPRRLVVPTDCGGGKAVAISDINLDGRPDIALTCENATGQKSGVRWFEFSHSQNNPRLVSTDHEISGPEGVKFDRIEMLDLDGDGDLDLITCEERANLGVIWYENPTR